MYIYKKKSRRQKAEETKEEKRISVVNLTGYDDIVCKFSLCTFDLLDQAWTSPGFSYEFNVVYVQWETLQYLLYYSNIWSTHFQEQN